MDPKTATREQFTQDLCSRQIPDKATAEWRHCAEKLQSLLRKLASHEAMGSNISQTYSTPAVSKNKVYFMWDFCGRTLGMLFAIPPDTPFDSGRVSQQWQDIITRTHMTADLILDNPPGMMDMMVQSVSPRDSGKDKDIKFGDAIKADAEGLRLMK